MEEVLPTIDWNEFDRQCKAYECQYDSNTPLIRGETLEPSLRGLEKIENDSELRELLRKVYRGEN